MVSDVTAEEAMSRLDPEDRALVEEFRSAVRQLLGPRLRDLRIFGSKVRGDDHDESDIDLLVLIEDADNEIRAKVVDLAHGIHSLLAAHPFDYESYHRPSNRATGFYKEIRKESVRL